MTDYKAVAAEEFGRLQEMIHTTDGWEELERKKVSNVLCAPAPECPLLPYLLFVVRLLHRASMGSAHSTSCTPSS